jgi:hypothetical protein
VPIATMSPSPQIHAQSLRTFSSGLSPTTMTMQVVMKSQISGQTRASFSVTASPPRRR